MSKIVDNRSKKIILIIHEPIESEVIITQHPTVRMTTEQLVYYGHCVYCNISQVAKLS